MVKTATNLTAEQWARVINYAVRHADAIYREDCRETLAAIAGPSAGEPAPDRLSWPLVEAIRQQVARKSMPKTTEERRTTDGS